jgi:hypothetical protein
MKHKRLEETALMGFRVKGREQSPDYARLGRDEKGGADVAFHGLSA